MVFHPSWASHWKLRHRVLHFERIPKLMGILNITPDSFSDGGRYLVPQAAIDQALRLEDEGADILDLGGESTRPYSERVSEEEELRRVVPVLEALQGRTSIPVSIDTSKARVARAAIELGAEIINDITGLRGDEAMIGVASQFKVGVCAMHMRGTPQDMQDDPRYGDVVAEVGQFLEERVQWLVSMDVERERICLDPGIGFGKTHQHNLSLIRSISGFHTAGLPILVGHSRKGFIAKVLGDKNAPRTSGTLGVSMALMLSGVQILRVHDVRENRHCLELFGECTQELQTAWE
jgi:dihydropteroate synthase